VPASDRPWRRALRRSRDRCWAVQVLAAAVAGKRIPISTCPTP